MKQSAGLAMFRQGAGGPEVLLGHMGGPFWAKKDDGAWTLFKGEYTDEEPLQAAVREFREETGIEPSGDFYDLGSVSYGGKQVRAWAFQGSCDPSELRSNPFSLEWPPRSGHVREFPEIDRAGWYSLDQARSKIARGQVPLIDALQKKLQNEQSM